VQYRAGDILLPASGTFVADSGRSIFLEQHFEQRGQHKQFRWEIPYQYIVRLAEKVEPPSPSTVGSPAPSVDARGAASSDAQPQGVNTAVAGGGASALLPLEHRPKTA
jgi:hypothetical protein